MNPKKTLNEKACGRNLERLMVGAIPSVKFLWSDAVLELVDNKRNSKSKYDLFNFGHQVDTRSFSCSVDQQPLQHANTTQTVILNISGNLRDRIEESSVNNFYLKRSK